MARIWESLLIRKEIFEHRTGAHTCICLDQVSGKSLATGWHHEPIRCLNIFPTISCSSGNGAMLSTRFFMTVCRIGFLVSMFMTNDLTDFYLHSVGMLSLRKCVLLKFLLSHVGTSHTRKFKNSYRHHNSAISLRKASISGLTKMTGWHNGPNWFVRRLSRLLSSTGHAPPSGQTGCDRRFKDEIFQHWSGVAIQHRS